MKILVIHNLHRTGSASGDDQVFKNEAVLLESHGHRVIRYVVSNDEFDQADITGKVRAALGMVWSIKHYKAVKQICENEKPDIVHIHTFFPLLSPSVLYAAKRSKRTVIATLHDTRFVCPCATSLLGTEICNRCGDGHYLRMCKYGCFKNSRMKSLIVAGIFKYHRIRKSFYNQIDKYICLNESQIELLKRTNFNSEKIEKKYNFVSDKDTCLPVKRNKELPERYVVFYGRIGKEKGIWNLMKVWESVEDIPLVVMGRGPLEEEFSKWAEEYKNVYFLGYVEHNECLSIVKNGMFVVFPSIWYEGCSMVEIESESLGKSLIAFDIGFSHEAIEDGVNGYKIPMNDIDGFAEKVRELWSQPQKCEEMGNLARLDYEKKYLPEDNYRQLIDIYKKALKD